MTHAVRMLQVWTVCFFASCTESLVRELQDSQPANALGFREKIFCKHSKLLCQSPFVMNAELQRPCFKQIGANCTLHLRALPKLSSRCSGMFRSVHYLSWMSHQAPSQLASHRLVCAFATDTHNANFVSELLANQVKDGELIQNSSYINGEFIQGTDDTFKVLEGIIQ